MGTGLVRRLLSAVLLALVAAGGGRLSTVDALVFHEGPADPDGFRAHFEASSGCHEDACSMRSTAHESRLTPLVATPSLFVALPESPAPAFAPRGAAAAFFSPSHLSRAPPLSV
ncbi:MAG TPA: hypothetical protein VLB00_06085 [Gemmatimonadales bacterium]|nr:hypothetical protein [Gemmatimonadales bacterium]